MKRSPWRDRQLKGERSATMIVHHLLDGGKAT